MLFLDKEKKQERLDICDACPHLKMVFDKAEKVRQCDICKCFMDIKAALERSKCPIKKW